MTEQELEELICRTVRRVLQETGAAQEPAEEQRDERETGSDGTAEIIEYQEEGHTETIPKNNQDLQRRKEACLIAVAGIKPGIGVTLHCVAFAKALQAAGHRIIIVEASGTQDLADCSIDGIPIHPDSDQNSLDRIVFDYDIILMDMGTYEPEMEAFFNRMDKKIVITGATPWEMNHISKIFSPSAKDYLFLFNHVREERRENIRRNMEPLKVVFSPLLEADEEPDQEMMQLVFPEYITAKIPEELPAGKNRRRKKNAGI